jgi:NAD(P)H-flavin reductase
MSLLEGVPGTLAGSAPPDAGRRVLAPFARRAVKVTRNEACGPYRLVGAEDPGAPAPVAGQFYMLAAGEGWGEGSVAGTSQRPFLARAFSVCRRLGERLDFLVEEIGPGTRRLAALRPGEELFLVGPLGTGFSLASVDGGGTALLVGGGAGIAPLVMLAEALVAVGTPVKALIGFRSAAYRDAARLFGSEVRIATDDGSLGHEGRVTELLGEELDRENHQGRDRGGAHVYACGPPAMLESVRRISRERSVAAELAMEEAMACGFGACFGCVVRTTTGYRRICVDGPVLGAEELDEGWLHA